MQYTRITTQRSVDMVKRPKQIQCPLWKSGASLEVYVNPESTPPRLPKPTCMAMPTARLVEPPMLFPFQATVCETLGYIPEAAKKVPRYRNFGSSVPN